MLTLYHYWCTRQETSDWKQHVVSPIHCFSVLTIMPCSVSVVFFTQSIAGIRMLMIAFAAAHLRLLDHLLQQLTAWILHVQGVFTTVSA